MSKANLERRQRVLEALGELRAADAEIKKRATPLELPPGEQTLAEAVALVDFIFRREGVDRLIWTEAWALMLLDEPYPSTQESFREAASTLDAVGFRHHALMLRRLARRAPKKAERKEATIVKRRRAS